MFLAVNYQAVFAVAEKAEAFTHRVLNETEQVKTGFNDLFTEGWVGESATAAQVNLAQLDRSVGELASSLKQVAIKLRIAIEELQKADQRTGHLLAQ